MNYSREKVNTIKNQYPVGTRIELNSLSNYEEGMHAGLRGTVVGVDDQPALLMRWDNGRGLSILIDEDDFRKLTPNEIENENEKKEEQDLEM